MLPVSWSRPLVVSGSLLLGLAVGGCAGGSEGKSSAADTGRADLDGDSGADSGTDSDAELAAEALARCLASWSDGVQEVDPLGPDTQIHTDVAFDGEHLWFVWNRPNEASNFDVFASSMSCDGGARLDPFEVSEVPDNEVDPTLAINEDAPTTRDAITVEGDATARPARRRGDAPPVPSLARLTTVMPFRPLQNPRV